MAVTITGASFFTSGETLSLPIVIIKCLQLYYLGSISSYEPTSNQSLCYPDWPSLVGSGVYPPKNTWLPHTRRGVAWTWRRQIKLPHSLTTTKSPLSAKLPSPDPFALMLQHSNWTWSKKLTLETSMGEAAARQQYHDVSAGEGHLLDCQ